MNSASAARLASCLRQILPFQLGVAALDVNAVDVSTLPGELVLVSAGAKRQREYAAGRIAAAEAIEACGHAPAYPGIGENRQPLWPQGLIGSISHTDQYALAAVTSTGVAASLGIDLEALRQLPAGLREIVLTTNELRRLRSAGSYDDESVLRLFSFKESVYKTLHPAFGRYIGFREIEISQAEDGLRAACTDPAHPAAELASRIRGDAVLDGDHLISACWMT